MIGDIKASPLYEIANPKSIAFFGASNNFNNMGTNLLLSIMSSAYEGTIYPIHPREETVQGLKAYKSALDLPLAPDLAVMVIPTQTVIPALRDCGEKGIRRVIVVSGGFKEVGGEGVALEKELQAVCRQYGIRLLGPNGLGVANPHQKLNTTFIPMEGPAGYIGLASQSGSFVTQMFNYLAGLNLGFSTAFSVGNEANVDLVDCLEYLGACPHTKVITLYVEGIRRGREFVEVARAVSAKKPIVAFYIGGSETGRKAGLSHTGAMAGPDVLYDGMFRQSGILRARSVTEMFDFAWVLGSLPRPTGSGVLIQTHSGGPGAAGADAAGRSGLELPSLSPQTIEKLQPFVPHTGSIGNPVDLTFTKNMLEFFHDIPQLLINEDNAHTLLIYFLTPEPIIARILRASGVPESRIQDDTNEIIDSCAKGITDLAKTSKKPIVGYTWRGLGERFSQNLIQKGLPLFPDPDRAARAIWALRERGKFEQANREERPMN